MTKSYECGFLDIIGDECKTPANQFRLIASGISWQNGAQLKAIPVCDHCLKVYLYAGLNLTEQEYWVWNIMQL